MFKLKQKTGSLLFIIFAVLLAAMPLAAQQAHESSIRYDNWDDGCTSITVGKQATTDGSVITCHTCDGNYRTWVNIVPHKNHEEGSTTNIYWGTLHTETPWDLRGKILKGKIPEIKETYAYLNVAYPCLNEKQLGIGETTIRGRRELRNDEGLFLIENLEQIVLQRCTTAREAIRLIGKLVKKYGYGDGGECITIADPKEVWQLEIFGAGPIETGSVWAAQRIPDGHVGISANIPRISTINLKDKNHFMTSDNVFSLAQEMGWWSPDSGAFKFWKAYSGRKPYSDREFFVLSTLAPSLHLNMEMEELPFSVKPKNKLSVRDVMKLYRQTYEGTDFDVTKNLMVKKRKRGRRYRREVELDSSGKPVMLKSKVANPWMSRDMMTLLNDIKPGTVKYRRAIAGAYCSYSQVIQLRDWLPDEVGGIAWFSFDNPGESPRIPIFSGTTELPKSFQFCAQQRYRDDSACWYFRRANKLATVAWGQTRKYIEDAVQQFEDKAFTDLPAIEKKAAELLNNKDKEAGKKACRTYLTQYTNDFARAAMNKWWELGDQFWTFFARGF